MTELNEARIRAAKPKQQFAAATREKAEWTFRELLFPYIGSRPMATITPPELLSVLRRIEVRGRLETCHRTKQRAGQVFRYAIATGRAERDITADLRDALAPVKTKHFAAITEPRRVGELLRAIDSYAGHPSTAYALRLAPYLFVRPGELRFAEWREFELEAAEWRIPAAKMKMDDYHLVPLSRQVVAVLLELRSFTGTGKYLFPSLRTRERPISDITLKRRSATAGVHRRRADYSWLPQHRQYVAERVGTSIGCDRASDGTQERNKVRAAYNRAQRLDERRKMMQAWADHGLRDGANVFRFKRSA